MTEQTPAPDAWMEEAEREKAFMHWFVMQSKMGMRRPEEIAGMGWFAALNWVAHLRLRAATPIPPEPEQQSSGHSALTPPTVASPSSDQPPCSLAGAATTEQEALMADLEHRVRYVRQPAIASFAMGDLAHDIASEMDRAIAAIRAYKWGYEYLQSRMESIDRHGWAHDCDDEILWRIAAASGQVASRLTDSKAGKEQQDSFHSAAPGGQVPTAFTGTSAAGDRRAGVTAVLRAAQEWHLGLVDTELSQPAQVARRDAFRRAVYELAGVEYEPIDAAIEKTPGAPSAAIGEISDTGGKP